MCSLSLYLCTSVVCEVCVCSVFSDVCCRLHIHVLCNSLLSPNVYARGTHCTTTQEPCPVSPISPAPHAAQLHRTSSCRATLAAAPCSTSHAASAREGVAGGCGAHLRFPGLGVMDVCEAQASGGTSGAGAPQPRRFPSEPNGGVAELSQLASPSPAPRSSGGGKVASGTRCDAHAALAAPPSAPPPSVLASGGGLQPERSSRSAACSPG